MNFNSIEYAVFLPIVFTLYWIVPQKLKIVVLLFSSYFFYMSWNCKYVILILFTTIISYFAAVLLDKISSVKIRKLILFSSIIICLGVLFFFKYFDFFFESISSVLSLFSINYDPIFLNFLLPVGISFYTFQTLSYVIDVYNKRVAAEYNPVIYATFVSYFPQLVAGPIERSQNLLPQMKKEKIFCYNQAIYGCRQIIWGLFKKVAVADVMGVYVDEAYNNIEKCTGFDLCVAIIFFTIQIYCDFSGYSDIAIGSSKLFGINLMKNFNAPYFSTSIKEFWSRWHISLSTWFKDYVYIPLGGNRKGTIRTNINLMITFLVSGLWHGANWTYILWGGLHGLAQVFEKSCVKFKSESKLIRIIRWFLLFVFCNLTWVFFRAENLHDAIYVIYRVFSNLSDLSNYFKTSLDISIYSFIYCVFAILIVFIVDYFSLKKDVFEWIGTKKIIIRFGIGYFIVALIIYSMLNTNVSNQFVYFQF